MKPHTSLWGDLVVRAGGGGQAWASLVTSSTGHSVTLDSHLAFLVCQSLPRPHRLEKETPSVPGLESRRLYSTAGGASKRGSEETCKKAKFKVVSTPNTMKWQLSN